MHTTIFEEKLQSAPVIRLFIGTFTLQEEDRTVECAVYVPSKIDEIYMAFPEKLTPCGKVRLQPQRDFTDAAGATHHGVVLVPADKSEAILAGCSMQNGRLTTASAEAQRQQYAIGRAALSAPTAG